MREKTSQYHFGLQKSHKDFKWILARDFAIINQWRTAWALTWLDFIHTH